MRCFWLSGEPRDKDNPRWCMYGSLPNSTACMLWSDGIDVAFIFNGRGKESHADIVKDLENVIERLKREQGDVLHQFRADNSRRPAAHGLMDCRPGRVFRRSHVGVVWALYIAEVFDILTHNPVVCLRRCWRRSRGRRGSVLAQQASDAT